MTRHAAIMKDLIIDVGVYVTSKVVHDTAIKVLRLGY